MKAKIDQYSNAVKEITTLQAESIGLTTKHAEGNAASTRVATIHGLILNIAKERTLPLGEEKRCNCWQTSLLELPKSTLTKKWRTLRVRPCLPSILR